MTWNAIFKNSKNLRDIKIFNFAWKGNSDILFEKFKSQENLLDDVILLRSYNHLIPNMFAKTSLELLP